MEFVALNIVRKEMSDGMRMLGDEPLNQKEIDIVKKEIFRIKADLSVFEFNNQGYHKICYVAENDKVCVGRNVFPYLEYSSTHPRDIMSIACVLAREYYGHRIFRNEYICDKKEKTVTKPRWLDEVRASLNAAKITPRLTRMEQSHLIMDAVYRAREFGQVIKNDPFMLEVLYGYPNDERHITGKFNEPVVFVSVASQKRNVEDGQGHGDVSEVQEYSGCRDLGQVPGTDQNQMSM